MAISKVHKDHWIVSKGEAADLALWLWEMQEMSGIHIRVVYDDTTDEYHIIAGKGAKQCQ